MIEVTSSSEIDASPEAVWSVLTDLAKFHIWNPFIRDASGSTELGGTVHVRVRPSLRVPLAFRARIYDREPNRRLCWRGHVAAPWFASGDHSFTIEPLGEHRARLVQRETFTGVLPWLARHLLARETQRGFDAMNRALAERARSTDATTDAPPGAAATAPSAVAAGEPSGAAATAAPGQTAGAASGPPTPPPTGAATARPAEPQPHRLEWPQNRRPERG